MACDAITDQRNALASQMVALLNGAAFENKPLRFDDHVEDLIEQAKRRTIGLKTWQATNQLAVCQKKHPKPGDILAWPFFISIIARSA